MVAAGLAQNLDLAAGDELPVEVLPGRTVTLMIVGIYFADPSTVSARDPVRWLPSLMVSSAP